MFSHNSRFCSILVGLSLVVAFGATAPATQSTGGAASGAAAVARAAASGVGIVTQTFDGASPGTIVVLEERHNSRVGQLQHALTMARLHDQFALKDIVLEGFLKERPPIDTTWFTKAVGVGTPVARARVAIQFLRGGEISAAEFVKLVYPDVALIQSETEATYRAMLPDSIPPEDYLKRIGRVDPAWAAQRLKSYETSEALLALSGDQHLALATEIKQYADSKRITVPATDRTAMDQFISFWQKRMASNTTIAAAVPPPPQSPRSVAIEIGSFHTAGVSALLKKAQRSHAVVKPAYTAKDAGHPQGETTGDLTDGMYDRKNKNLSVFSRGLSAIVSEEVGGALKPEPVLEREFIAAEGEFYAFTTKLTAAVLGKGSVGGPPNGPTPPFGLAAGDFDGKSLRIALSSVQYVPGQGKKRDALLIPVTFKRSGHIVWVGTLIDRTPARSPSESVESILLQAIRQVQSERTTPEQAEDAQGRLKLDDQTIAIVGRDQAAVKRALLAES